MVDFRWKVTSNSNIELFFQPQDKYCFLVGSGISVDPPSSLPTGFQFSKKLLKALIPPEKLTKILKLINYDNNQLQISGNFLRFEQLMEYVQKWIDPELKILNCYAQPVPPNFNHIFLAQMLLNGHSIITTNFDCLIEEALIQLNIPKNLIYPVINQKDWEVLPNSSFHKIYKLHGSLFNIRTNQECRESLLVTLAQIGRSMGEIFQLDLYKRQILHSLFQKYDLVVLGYSGFDDFDILPTLWNIKSDKRILWITHDSEYPPERAIIEKITLDTSNEHSTEINRSDKVQDNLISFLENNARHFNQIYHIRVHTGQFLSKLWRINLTVPRPDIVELSHETTKFSSLDIPNLSEAFKWILTGKIFIDSYYTDEGLKAYHTALNYAKKDGNLKLESNCLADMGLIFKKQGKMDNTLKFYEKALEISYKLGDQVNKSIRLINIGRLNEDQGNYGNALNYYIIALKISKNLRDQLGIASCKNNIGMVYKILGRMMKNQNYYILALEYYNQALEIYRNCGDLSGIAMCTTNIGVIYREQKEYELALEYYKKALKIADKIGDLNSSANYQNNIGIVLKNQGKFKEAQKVYEKVLKNVKILKYVRGESRTLFNIGCLLRDQGKSQKASRFFLRSQKIAQRINDKELLIDIYKNLKMLNSH